MATAKTVVDSTSRWGATVANKFVTGDGTTSYAPSIWGLRIRYNGSAWEATTSIGAATDQASKVSFLWNTNRVEISLTSVDNQFNAVPLTLVTPYYTNSTDPYIPTSGALDKDTIWVTFWDTAGTAGSGPAVLVATEDTQMDCNLLMFGKIG